MDEILRICVRNIINLFKDHVNTKIVPEPHKPHYVDDSFFDDWSFSNLDVYSPKFYIKKQYSNHYK